MILVGVDPGKVTGIAVWWDPHVYDNSEKGSDVDTAEVESSTAVVPVIRRMLRCDERDYYRRPFAIGVERYIQNTRKTHQPAASEVTGAVKSLCEELLVRCVYQSPGPAKRAGSTNVLKKLGWWTPTPDGHANAALGNMLLLMATVTPQRYAELTGL